MFLKEKFAKSLEDLAIKSKKEGMTIVSSLKPTNPKIGQIWKKINETGEPQGLLVFLNFRDILNNIEGLQIKANQMPNKGVWFWYKFANSNLASFVPELDKNFIPDFKHVNMMIDVLNFQVGRGYYGFGHAGTGKTSTASWMMAVLRQPCIHINCRTGIEAEEFFLSQIAINGKWSLQLGPILRAITMDVPIVIDELDLAPSELWPSLNNLIEGRKVVIPNFPEQLIQPKAGFKFIGFGNSLNEWEGGLAYEGRNTLDSSFLDRMIIDYYDDLSAKQIKSILISKYQDKIEESLLESLADLYDRLRKKDLNLTLRKAITICDLFLANKENMKYPMAYAIGSVFTVSEIETVKLMYSMAFKLSQTVNVNDIFKNRFSLIDAKPKKAKKEKEPEEEIKNAS